MAFREQLCRATAEAEDLNRTISMKRDDFMAHIGESKRLQAIKGTVDWDSYHAICEFRSYPKESLMRLCKHPEHEAANTGIAACKIELCPRLLEVTRKK